MGGAKVPEGLADHGITAAEYDKIRKARALVDDVDAALAARGAPLTFSVSLHVTEPVRPDGRVEIRE